MSFRRIRSLIRKAIILVLTLAAVGTAYLWVEGYVRTYTSDSGATLEGRHIDIIRGRRSEGTIAVSPGRWWFVYYTHDTERTLLRKLPVTRRVHYGLFLYSNYSHRVRRKPALALTVTFPSWAPFVLFATYPTVALIRGPVRRYRRRRKGSCLECGYNLTGLPEPRCPECGTDFDPSTLPQNQQAPADKL